MLMPSIFNNNLFDDDWFGFPFYGYADKAENRAEKKLYGHHANNLMKTDIKEMKDGYELEIYVDEHLVEVFINNGEYVISNVVYGLTEEITGKNYDLYSA